MSMLQRLRVVTFVLLLAAVALVGAACAQPAGQQPAAQQPAAQAPTEPPAQAEPTAEMAAEGLSGTIKVGCAHALSGPIALYGEPIQNGIMLAAEEINNQGYLGDATLEIICEDTAGDKAQSINAFQKLINQDDVVAILGPTLSNSAFAADPVAQEAKIPVLGSSNTATGITDMGNYVFRDSLPESDVIPNTIQVTRDKLGYDKVAVMYGNDDQFTKSGYDVFKATLDGQGVEILTTETFAKGDTDFSAQLTKIKSLEPQAIVVSALAEEAANIMVQARQLGITEDVRFIGGNGFNSPKLAEIAGDAAEGAISGAAWSIADQSQENQDFIQAYRDKYGSDPDQFAAQSYTATWLMAKAIKDANSTDPAAIRDALGQIRDFPSPLGTFSFDENRNPVHAPVVLVVHNGEFEVFE
jgi:branched-chain amino acid transport system substrate-binding protein